MIRFSALKLQLVLAILTLPLFSFSQSDFYKYPEVVLGYNFGKNNIKAEVSYMFLHEKLCVYEQERGGYANDNFFVDFLSDFSMGPVIGYEYNFVFLELKTSVVNLNDFGNESNLIIRPEIGVTLLGAISLNYGYNWTVYKIQNKLSGFHQISISYNHKYFE
tara:strand:+ start:74 stop:559 length:486 start_codon:yes stop_codon:yes gene_type:complete